MIKFNSEYDYTARENLELLRCFLEDSWLETYPEQVGDAVTSTMISAIKSDDLGGIVPTGNGRIITAMNQDKLIGSCVHMSKHETTYVWGFYVRRLVQRTGIGRAMLELVIDEKPRHNSIQIIVLHKSTDAVRFYKNMGFLIVSQQDFQVTPAHSEPAYIMEYTGNRDVYGSERTTKNGRPS